MVTKPIDRVVRDELAALRPHGVLRPSPTHTRRYYQAIRRCYRYGQTRRVHAHIVLSELEGQIAANVARKEKQATQMTEELVREMQAAGELRMP